MPNDSPGDRSEPAEPDGSAVAVENLRYIFDMLSREPATRTDLVDDIRRRLNDGTYMTEEKLNLAIYRVIKDLME